MFAVEFGLRGDGDEKLAAVALALWVDFIGKSSRCDRALSVLAADLRGERVAGAAGADFRAVGLLAQRIAHLDKPAGDCAVNRAAFVEAVLGELLEIGHGLWRVAFVKLDRHGAHGFLAREPELEQRDIVGKRGNCEAGENQERLHALGVCHGPMEINLVGTMPVATVPAHFMTHGLPARGQRWVSNSEPELGLGVIEKCEFGRVEVHFPASDERRQYATESAPLRRVRYAVGDTIAVRDSADAVVVAVEEKAGLLVYRTAAGDGPEGQLSAATSFSKPEDRLYSGQVDDLHVFDLRVRALRRRCELRQSPVRGFVGGRVDLLPHQMSIAAEVAARLVPRVLLADEVGLGKTIEAGLILHRLHLTGRAARILILLPEALVNQWFVELLRRFNLLFSIFDEDRCESIVEHDGEANPFLDSQLVLCDVAFLSKNPDRARQAVDAGWDLLVVDEAHHLEWSPTLAGDQYLLVEQLAKRTPGLLLLTATPQQLGPEGHFARLRLLDPDRYSDLAKFLEEAEHYEQVARALDRLLAGEPLSAADRKLFSSQSPRVAAHLDGSSDGLVNELLDAFGTGRVMFRNTRAALTGFPKRKAHLVELAGEEDTGAKVKWLAAFLKKHAREKVLLICKTRPLVEEIAELLQREIAVNAGVFHEGLTLLQRDRNAAYFSEEDGARVLLCSEIGSEGRNFQFAHHLVLFDLPENPELLEQRIGRLDRIGQTATIHIHVPFLAGTDGEALAKWYHEGLAAFEHHPHGAGEISSALRKDLDALADTFSAKNPRASCKSDAQIGTRQRPPAGAEFLQARDRGANNPPHSRCGCGRFVRGILRGFVRSLWRAGGGS